MALTYDEFKKIVPKETSTFFDELLPYLNYYVEKGEDIDFVVGDYSSHRNESKVFFLSLYALSNLKEYMAFLGELGYKRNVYIIAKDKINTNTNNLEALYEKFNYLLPVYNDKTLYYGLQPLEIVEAAYQKYYNTCSHNVFDITFGATNHNNFRQKVQGVIKEKKQIQDREIEKEIYTQVPISVISYIETASKVRTFLLNKLSYSNNGIARELDIDIVPLSLLLALFYNSNNTQTKDNANNQAALVCFLKEKGITFEKIVKVLNISLSTTEIKGASKNIYAIQNLYSKYYKVGNTININPTSVSVQSIFKNILDRNFTNSLVIEKLFSSLDCSVDMFKNIEVDILRALETQKRNQEQESIKSFYKDVPKKTRDFIEFAVKTYTVIIEKMHENKHNDKILSTEKDAVILALYISSFYFNGNISEYFNDNGVSCSKVLKLLNLDLKKEDIEKVNIDRKILVDKFKRFVYEGENSNQTTSKLGINAICNNMCNRDFTQSMLLENIFNSLSSTTEINGNFLSQLKEHFTNKAKNQEIEKTQKLFYDIPVETITIMENASRVYHKLLKSKKGLDKKGAQTISVLLSALNSNNKEVRDFLTSQGFYSNHICNYFELDGRYLWSDSIDIDLLARDYGLLMFGLSNKDRKRQELTPINIIRNIFSKDFNNSVAISKFLSENKLSYDDFANFDALYQKYIATQEKAKREKNVKDYLNKHQSEPSNQIKNAARVHKLIEEAKEKGSFNQELIKSETDMECLCMVLALFYDTTTIRYFFKKNGIDSDKIISIFGLPNDILANYSAVEIDYELIKERYQKYLKGGKSKNDITISSMFNCLLDENSFVKTIVELADSDYEKLEREIKTGKDFEETITVDDRIKNLSKEKSEKLDPNNMQSILDFGKALLPHSQYIHSELPKLMHNDANEGSISTISTIIGELYVYEEPEKSEQGFLSRIFNGVEEQPAPKLFVNRNKLYELKNTIDEKVEKLKQELLKYDSIRRYIEEYSIKNRSYFQIADEAIQKVNTRLAELNPEDDDQYAEYLTTSSLLQIVNDKATRFATVNLLMRKELLKVNQAIVNHFVTINSLEMARDDLIPLIESELTIASGRNTENEALDLAKNVMGLFQSLLTRNVDSAIENMHKLQQANVSEEIMTSINNEINTYIQGVSQIKSIESRLEKMEEKTTTSEKVLAKGSITSNKK